MTTVFHALQAAPPQHAAADEPLKPRHRQSDIPPRSCMPSEIALKQESIRCILLRIQQKEKRIFQTQAHVEALSAEKNRREKELMMTSALLPSSVDVAALNRRLKKARDAVQNSTKTINDADAYLSLVDAVNRGKDFDEEKRRREDVKLRRSVMLLKNEISNLRAQLHQLTSDVHSVDATKDNQHSSCKKKGTTTTSFRGPVGMARLLKEKKKCEERLNEAKIEWNMATQREAKAARLLKRLERRPVSAKTASCIKDKSTYKIAGYDDNDLSPLGKASFPAASVSSESGKAGSLDSSIFYERHLSPLPTLKQTSSKGELPYLMTLNNKKRSTTSETEIFSRQMGHLAAQYVQMKRRVDKLRKTV